MPRRLTTMPRKLTPSQRSAALSVLHYTYSLAENLLVDDETPDSRKRGRELFRGIDVLQKLIDAHTPTKK